MSDLGPTPGVEAVCAMLKPADFLRALARRWLLIAGCAVVGLSLCAVYLHFNPDEYESYAIVRFNPPQLPNRFVASNDSLQTDQRMFALTQLLGSSLTARRLIESLGLYPRRRRFQTVEDLVEKFQKGLGIQRATSPGAGANRGIPSLRIAFSYGDAGKSKQVVEQLVEAVHETSRRYRGDQAAGTTGFLEAQAGAAEAELQQLEDEISQLGMSDRIAGGHDWAYRVQELFNLEYRLGQVQHSLRQTQRERSDKQNDLVEQESRLRRVDLLVTARTHEMPWEIRVLQQWLNKAVVTHEELKQRYNPNHPDVPLAAAEVEKLQKRLRNEMEEEVQSTRLRLQQNTNRAIDLLRGDIEALDASIRRLQIEEASFAGKASAVRDALRISPGSDMEYLRLSREYQATKLFHESLLHKRQESMVALEMERAGRGEAMELVEPPTLPLTPRIPASYFKLLFGLVLGASAASAWVLFRMLLDPVVSTPRHLALFPGMVLLADVPPLLAPGSRLPGRGITRRLLAWKRVPVTGFLIAVLGASTLFSSACSLRPLRSKEALLASGLRAEKAGKLAEAIILYKQALQSDARFGEAHGCLARLELEIGSVEAARFHLLRAVELQPSNFDAHVRLAGLNYQIYFADSARPPLLLLEMENVANQLVQGWPQRPQGYSHQSTVLLERHRGAEAAALIRGAMSRIGSESSLQTQLASIEHSLGHKEEAIALLRELVARGSNHSPAYDLLYLQLMEANRNNEAEQCLREKWRNVGDLDSGLQLAAHYYASGGNELVRRQLDEVLKKLGGSVETQARVGDFWLHRGEPERARAGYEAGLEAHPSSRELYIGRFVELSLAQQDRRAAISLLENELRLGARSDLLLAYRSALDLDQAGKAELSRIRAQLEAIVSRVPRSAFVRYHLGRAYLRAGDVVRGEQQLEKCLRLDPNYAPGWMALADTEFKRGNHGRAERRVDQMLAHAPRNVPALLMKARLQASRGSLADADATLEQVSGRGVPDTLVRLERASLRLLSDDPQGSIRLLEPALRATPGDDRVIVALALAEAAAGNHNQALERLDRAVAEHPDSLRVLAARASAGLQSGDPVRAAADYRRLKEKSPEQVEFSIGLADALALAGKLSDAAAEYRRAQLIEPSNPRAWLNLAAVLIAAGDRTAAKDAYARALGLDANNPFILNNYSYLLARGGENLSYALQLAQQADRLMPGSREIGDTLVYVHTRLGMHQQAITQLDQLLTRTPQGARKTLENLRAGLHRGDVKGSLRLMEQARDQHAEAQLRGAS